MMNDRKSLHAILLSTIGPALRQGGFEYTGESFSRAYGANLLVVEPQQSVKSTPREVLFTFNLMVYSGRLAKVVDSCDPLVGTCYVPHWRQRLGGLLEAPGDHWWSFAGEPPVDAASALVNRGIPAINAVSTDEGLRDLWLSGRAPGLSELQRRIYLSALLGMIGPRSELLRYVELLDSVPTSDPTRERIERHLRLLQTLGTH